MLNSKAIQLLEEAMLFWHGEGSKLIRRLDQTLNKEGQGRLAAEIAKVWRDVDDRWIDIAAKLAPYQSAKLSSIEVNKNETRRFVIVAPQVVPDKKQWLEKVVEDQKLLPKPTVIQNVLSEDDVDDIDEIEYDEIHER